MANSADRRAAVDKIRRDAQRADQRQGRIILTVAVMIALLIVGGVAAPIVLDKIKQSKANALELSEIGAKASVCDPRVLRPANGTQDHVEPGTPVDYSAEPSPPAFGKHENIWDPIGRKFYTSKDRPNLEKLVHNLEHGYSIVWYDETVAKDDDQITDLRAIADKYAGEDDFRLKIKIVPWTEDDGDAFPKGMHIAITHWAKEPAEADEAIAAKAKVEADAGVWQYCSEVSGAAVQKFMNDYPYLNSQEPTAG